MNISNDNSGFTLVELILSLVISSIIIATVFAGYKSQRDTYDVQDQVTEIQQNLRAAALLMGQEMRMAAYDPKSTGKYKILKRDSADPPNETDADSFRFDADMCDDGGKPISCAESPEKFYYNLNASGKITRTIKGSAIAENIEALEFYYTYNDGTPPNTSPANSSQAEHIQSVQISILGRARRPDPEFRNNIVYTPASGSKDPKWGPHGDNFRRRLLITTVYVRNQGI